MTLKDLNELINNLKANGLTENQMQITFLLMYRNNKISYSDLKLLMAKINYSIDEEIDNLSEDERKQMINDMFKGLE